MQLQVRRLGRPQSLWHSAVQSPSLVHSLRSVLVAMAASAFIPVCGHAQTGPDLAPVTVDALLRNEAIGMAAFSPEGRWLAYNRVPPYEDIGDYSYWMYAYSLSGHRLWVRDLAGKGPSRLQPGLREAASNYLFGFSGDGQYVVVLEHARGRLDIVACRTAEDVCQRLGRMPDIRDMYVAPSPWNERLVWSGPSRLLVPVRDGIPGSELRSRAAVGDYLRGQWDKAWDGRKATASEVRSTGADRSEDWAEGSLLEFDIATGENRVVADGRFAGVRISPGQRFAAAARVGERIRPPADAGPRRRETHPMFDRRYAPVLIDLQTGTPLVLPGPFMVDPHSFAWAQDGRRLALYGWERGEAPEDGRFYVVDTASMRISHLDHDAVTLANSRLNPSAEWFSGPARAVLLSEGLAVYGSEAAGDAGWFLLDTDHVRRPRALAPGEAGLSGHPLYADDKGFHVLGARGLLRLSPAGPPQPLFSPGDGEVRDLFYTGNAAHAWSNEFRFDAATVRSPLGRSGGLRVTDPAGAGDREVVLIDHADPMRPAILLAPGEASSRILAASLEAGAAVISMKDGAATRLVLVRQDGGAPEELAVVNRHLNSIARPPTTRITYEVPDPGAEESVRSLGGCLVLPYGYEPGRAYPVLVEVYPGGRSGACQVVHDAPNAVSLSAAADLWAAQGFVYFRPSIPLDLARTEEGPVAGMDGLVNAAVDALIAEGYADPGRVVLFGFSQGGVSALYVAARSDRFAAVISMNGWANFFSHYFGGRGLMRVFHLDQNGGDNRWRYECTGSGVDHTCPFGLSKPAFDEPEAYARLSPVAMARSITAPVLLIHSDLDYFDMAQYDEMFGALYRAGREARYVRYWGEGHSPSSPANIRDLWQRTSAFLEENGITSGD